VQKRPKCEFDLPNAAISGPQTNQTGNGRTVELLPKFLHSKKNY